VNTAYVDSNLADSERRERLYDGQIFVFSPRPSTLALVEHARTMPAVGGADLVLSTEGARAEDIAARIRQDARL
jgi:hypothetical protein